MPIYTFENTKTGKVYDDMMSISEKEEFLEKTLSLILTSYRHRLYLSLCFQRCILALTFKWVFLNKVFFNHF